MAAPSTADTMSYLQRCLPLMQAGTAMMLRLNDKITLGTFTLDKDCKIVNWQAEQQTGQLVLSEVSGIQRSKIATQDGGSVYMMRIQQGDDLLEILCYEEQFLVWYPGLGFLTDMDSLKSPTGIDNESNASRSQEPERTSDKDVIRKQQEEIQYLKEKNTKLQQALQAKDRTIAALERLQGQKAASASHESDAHLKDRKVVLLEQRNARLAQALQVGQDTASDLVQVLVRTIQRSRVMAVDLARSPEGEAQIDVRPPPFAPVDVDSANEDGEMQIEEMQDMLQNLRLLMAVQEEGANETARPTSFAPPARSTGRGVSAPAPEQTQRSAASPPNEMQEMLDIRAQLDQLTQMLHMDPEESEMTQDEPEVEKTETFSDMGNVAELQAMVQGLQAKRDEMQAMAQKKMQELEGLQAQRSKLLETLKKERHTAVNMSEAGVGSEGGIGDEMARLAELIKRSVGGSEGEEDEFPLH